MSQRLSDEKKGTEQENNFPVLKGKKVHLVIAILVSQKQHCSLVSLPRELLERHSKPIFSDILSGPGESLSLWFRESRAQHLTKPLGQWLQSHPKEDEGAAGSAISNLNVVINQGNL